MIGIYKITNKLTQDFYIGSSTHIKYRWWRHITFLNKKSHWNPFIQNSWNKYGRNAFEFSVLELCPVNKLQEREQYYIDTLRPNFNACPRAYTTAGRHLSKETLLKMHFFMLSKNKGKKCSEEQKEKIRKALKGRKNPEHSARMKGRIPWNKGKTGLWHWTKEALEMRTITYKETIKKKHENNRI